MSSLQKYRSVVDLVKEACKQLSLPVPVGVYDAADEHAILMGSVINTAGVLVNEAHPWQQMMATLVCVGDGVRTAYDLPSNFARFTDNTGWSNAIRRPVRVINAQQWAAISSWLSQSFYINPACRIMNDQLQFMSPPAVGDSIRFQYQKATWVQDADDAQIFKAFCDKNGDVPQFDWTLMLLAIKIKWREGKGMSTLSAQADFQDRLNQLTQSNAMGAVLDISGGAPGGFRYIDGYYNVPDSNFGL